MEVRDEGKEKEYFQQFFVDASLICTIQWEELLHSQYSVYLVNGFCTVFINAVSECSNFYVTK